MKKIVLLIALALGIFACDDGKKDNGGGNSGLGVENLGNIKIGDTLSGKSIPIKSALSTPAETSISFNSPDLSLNSNLIEFDLDNEDCKQYWRVDPEGQKPDYMDLPIGVSCNLPYTLTPLLFARYTITYSLTSVAKTNVMDIKTESGKIEFVASADGKTEPPADIEYIIPQLGGTVDKLIKFNGLIYDSGEYLFMPYGDASFINTESGRCLSGISGNDCFSIGSGCSVSYEEQTYGNSSYNVTKIKVPQNGCDLSLEFQIGTNKAFDQPNGFYLRPGDRLDTPVPTNVPVQRFVIKR